MVLSMQMHLAAHLLLTRIYAIVRVVSASDVLYLRNPVMQTSSRRRKKEKKNGVSASPRVIMLINLLRREIMVYAVYARCSYNHLQ